MQTSNDASIQLGSGLQGLPTSALSLGDVNIPAVCVVGLSETSGHDFTTHKPLSGAPILQATGPSSRSLKCSLFCHQAFVNPGELLEQLRGLARSGAFFHLYRNETERLGLFGLKDISVDEDIRDHEGECLSVKLTFTLESVSNWQG